MSFKYPAVFDEEWEDETIHERLDGSEWLYKYSSFQGERGEVLEELKKIVANWPDGMYENGKFDVSIGVELELSPPTKKLINPLPIEQRFGPEYPEILSSNGCLQHIEVFANGAERLRDCISGEGSSEKILTELKEIIANWPHGMADKGKFHFHISMETMIKGELPRFGAEEAKTQASA